MFDGRVGDDFAKAFLLIIIGSFGLGVISVWLIPIVWNWIKPFIHAWTA